MQVMIKVVGFLVLAAIIVVGFGVAKAQAQSNSTVAFTVSPNLVSAGQATSLLLTLSSTGPSIAATLQTGDKFFFTFAASIGSVTSFSAPVVVSSSTLTATDFAVALGSSSNQIVIIYNGVSQPFPYGNTVSLNPAPQGPPGASFNPVQIGMQRWYHANQVTNFPLGPGSVPVSMTFDGTSVWVLSNDAVGGNLAQIRPADGKILNQYSVGGLITGGVPVAVQFDASQFFVRVTGGGLCGLLRVSSAGVIGGNAFNCITSVPNPPSGEERGAKSKGRRARGKAQGDSETQIGHKSIKDDFRIWILGPKKYASQKCWLESWSCCFWQTRRWHNPITASPLA